MKKLMITLALAVATSALSATQYSKLAVITAAKKAGVWANLKTFIAEADLKDEWDACQYLTDDHPMFAAATNMLVKTGVATAEQVGAILSASIDTSVSDALISRVYKNAVKSKAGRGKWHGKIVRTVVDDETLIKTTTYEDGTVFTDAAKLTTAISSAQAAKARVVATNGVPARLAAARLKVAADAGKTNTVTITIKAGTNQ